MIRTVGKMENGGDWIVIFDDGTAPLHVDLVTEVVEEDGIIRISFAAVSKDGDGIAKADVVARIRMIENTAWDMCRRLKGLER